MGSRNVLLGTWPHEFTTFCTARVQTFVVYIYIRRVCIKASSAGLATTNPTTSSATTGHRICLVLQVRSIC